MHRILQGTLTVQCQPSLTFPWSFQILQLGFGLREGVEGEGNEGFESVGKSSPDYHYLIVANMTKLSKGTQLHSEASFNFPVNLAFHSFYPTHSNAPAPQSASVVAGQGRIQYWKLHLEVGVEMSVQGLVVAIPLAILRALVLIFYQLNKISPPHYICKRVNNQIQPMRPIKKHHSGPKPRSDSPPLRDHPSSSRLDPLKRLVLTFSEVDRNKEWMVPLGETYSNKIDGRLVGNTYIISGPAQSGKTALVYWALRHDEGETAIVVVDCGIHRTEMQFIQKLAREVGEQIGVGSLDRRAVAQENIKFSELNGAIRQQQRPVLILIRNAERLVEYRKQILLYNLLEWVASDIKKWVGLVFTTRLISFVDRFEKRVRSRLCAHHISLVRPAPELLMELLVRRVEWLCEQEREYVKGCAQRQRLYEKVFLAMRDNRKLIEVIRKNQEYAQKDIVFFLNAMKLVFSGYQSEEEIMRMDDRALREDLVRKMEESFIYIFPFIPKNLLKTCTFPEYLVMALIHYMGKHQRTPYRFKTVYEVYLQFKQKLVTSEGMGSSFIYSKNVLQRSVLKLEELSLIELDNKEESVWNCDIRCAINPEEIEKAFHEINDLPNFFLEILKA